MPPLITREEALALGELTEHAEIEALVERGWQRARRALRRLDRHVLAGQREVRRLRRGLRLLRPVALRRRRHADARDDGARADARARARRRGGRRAPLLHGRPGPGPLASATSRRSSPARGWSPSTPTSSAAPRSATCPPSARRRCARPGIQRVHHNVESAESFYPEVSATVRYEGRLRTIAAVREAGLETCVGGILNLGETREQRVEMAFELSAINPTSVPINLLIPRAGTKFGERELMDPWEAVKWVAIFRLILPEALFRLCGGRIENLGELGADGRPGRAQRRDDGQLPDRARRDAGRGPRDVRAARASTSPASPTTAPTRARTTAPAGSRARRPT